MPGIGKQQNILDALYNIVKLTVGGIFRLFEYLSFIAFAISDYAMTFASGILAVEFVEHTPFPTKILMYAFVFIRAALLVFGFRQFFILCFDSFHKQLFTRKNPTVCQGNVDGITGFDGQPMCQTAIYNGSSALTGESTKITYQFQRMDYAKYIAVKQMAMWIVYLNLFVIPATIR